MKVMWLNESLVLRAEDQEERKALAVIFAALDNSPEEQDIAPNTEGCEAKCPSASQ